MISDSDNKVTPERSSDGLKSCVVFYSETIIRHLYCIFACFMSNCLSSTRNQHPVLGLKSVYHYNCFSAVSRLILSDDE